MLVTGVDHGDVVGLKLRGPVGDVLTGPLTLGRPGA
jgi:hypothetical protein